VKVKAAVTVNSSDSRGLHRLAAQAGLDFRGGIVSYNWDRTLPLGAEALRAVPFAKRWEM